MKGFFVQQYSFFNLFAKARIAIQLPPCSLLGGYSEHGCLEQPIATVYKISPPPYRRSPDPFSWVGGHRFFLSEASALRLEAIALRLDASALRLEASALGLEAIALRLEVPPGPALLCLAQPRWL